MPQSLLNGLNRRSLLKSMGAAAGLAGAGSFISFTPSHASDVFKVTMQLGWLASNGNMGEICANKLGYFAEEGLEFEIIQGGPNIDGVASVASGRANLGQVSSSPSLMLARAAGIPVKCIAAGYQQHPYTYFSLKENPITKPEDMIGKKIGTQATGRILYRALLAKNGIPEDEVELVIIGSDMNPLMTGQVDAITGWKSNVKALEILGDRRVDLTLWDAGIKLYANPFYVTDSTLADHGDKVDAMIRAISRGWGFARENPEKAVDYLVEAYPNMDRTAEMEAVPLVLDYSFNENTKEHGWGTMTAANWQDQIDIYQALGQFDGGAPTVDEVMTLSVLEATADTRPKLG